MLQTDKETEFVTICLLLFSDTYRASRNRHVACILPALRILNNCFKVIFLRKYFIELKSRFGALFCSILTENYLR
jgi:hypothetical protein